MLVLFLAASCASAGCMNAAYRYRPEGTPASHAIIGGAVGDLGLAAVTGAIIGIGDDDKTKNDVRYFLPIAGSLLLVDAALLTILYLTRK